MAKTYRRKQPASRKKKQKEHFPWKKAGLLFLSLILFFSAYQIAIYFYQGWIVHTYCIAAGVLVVLYALINRGVFSIPSPENLPDEWSKEQKAIFIAEQQKRRRISSVLLYFLIPILMTVVWDMVYLFLTLNMGLKL